MAGSSPIARHEGRAQAPLEGLLLKLSEQGAQLTQAAINEELGLTTRERVALLKAIARLIFSVTEQLPDDDKETPDLR